MLVSILLASCKTPEKQKELASLLIEKEQQLSRLKETISRHPETQSEVDRLKREQTELFQKVGGPWTLEAPEEMDDNLTEELSKLKMPGLSISLDTLGDPEVDRNKFTYRVADLSLEGPEETVFSLLEALTTSSQERYVRLQSVKLTRGERLKADVSARFYLNSDPETDN